MFEDQLNWQVDKKFVVLSTTDTVRQCIALFNKNHIVSEAHYSERREN